MSAGGDSLALEEHHEAGAHGHASSFPLTPAQVGMICFLVTEAAFFSTLILAYIAFINVSRPIAAEVFQMPLTLGSSVCLLSSSFTVHLATGALQRGHLGGFRLWLGVTVLLGGLFLAGTALEWRELIVGRGITIASNLFGTTYFTLIGFHGLHVTIGLTLLAIVLGLALNGRISQPDSGRVELLSWYWHFVDAVWVVIFIVVYLVGRGGTGP